MNGRHGQLSWATASLAGVAFVAASAAAARADLRTAAMSGAVNAVILADDAGGQRERVIQAVQRRFNAKVVRVTETTVNGRPALELRLLSEQRVWNLVVDATTGQILAGA
ncbi:MAG TPA: PepSY domain-containing protein [Steroidobacteraceae bacterium]